jgi:DNA-binding MarR family transcriptional regulator
MHPEMPQTEELLEITKILKERQFLYISSFADLLSRYMEVMLKFPLRFTALSLLIRKNGSLTPTELSRLMFRSKHSITKIIDGLEKEGYVARFRDNIDRRVVHVKITAEGVAHIRDKLAIENPMVQDLLSCLGNPEAEIFLSQIKRLRREVIKALLERSTEVGE